jgi:outer membrane protein assembly factor BamC
METDWAENRAKLPQDIIRNTLGKVFDSLYSTGERDKFRTRLERGADGGTEIYITHRGMEEVYTTSNKDRHHVAAAPADPELEAEFLRRLMVKLGGGTPSRPRPRPPPRARPRWRAPPRSTASPWCSWTKASTAPGAASAWLDRTGFTVEDRDRAKGLYFVRYVDPNPDKKEPGFFGKLFGSATATPRRQVPDRGAQRRQLDHRVGAHQRRPRDLERAQRIVQVLADDRSKRGHGPVHIGKGQARSACALAALSPPCDSRTWPAAAAATPPWSRPAGHAVPPPAGRLRPGPARARGPPGAGRPGAATCTPLHHPRTRTTSAAP